jgi:thiamine transport system substrate-binding protein
MNHSNVRSLLVAITIALIATACSSTPQDSEVVLLTHDSFALSQERLDLFTEQSGITLTIQTAGDAGTMVNQAILTKDNPIADVMYGIDNTFLSRALDNDLFLAYRAADIDSVDEILHIGDDLATPIDFGDVCINYDIAAFEELGIDPPTKLRQLIDPTYKDMLVVEDPATSSPGLAFLLATIAALPDGSSYGWKAFWTDLFANGVAVAPDWTNAYTGRFTLSGGDRPLVVSYASSPAAEVLFGELDAAPSASLTNGCYRQIEYAGILKGTDNEGAAREVIDFLLEVRTQEDIPLNMFVYPVNRNAVLPEIFTEFTVLPNTPAIMDPQTVDANRERWIQEWTAIARS